MKILKSVIRYKCDYCSRVNIQKPAMDRHERICYLNPNRECDICDNEGLATRNGVGAELGVIPDAYTEICTACLKAKIMGGKCYISNDHWVKYIQPVLDEMSLVIGENTDFDDFRVPLSTNGSDWHKFIRLVNSKI